MIINLLRHAKNVLLHYLPIVQLYIGMIKILILRTLHFLLRYKMVRSDKASSGVAFSLDTESGFKNTVVINASYGLGEAIVQGIVIPDEFVIFKLTLKQAFAAIIKKERGSKTTKIVYDEFGTKQVAVPRSEQWAFSLTDEDVLLAIAKAVCVIEDLYTKLKGSWSPMDIEWAKDGKDGKIYIVQARPETIHARENHLQFQRYELQNSARTYSFSNRAKCWPANRERNCANHRINSRYCASAAG